MKKPFLLVAGDQYYPERGAGDWIACFETAEEARAQVSGHQKELWRSKLQRPSLSDFKTFYTIGESTREYDWFEIIDLREWAE